MADEAKIFGVCGEFDDVTAAVRAARAVREAGYTRFDVYSPFPIHGIDSAMGIRPTILPWIVLACGLTGCLTGLGLAIYTMAPPPEFTIPSPWGPIPGYPLLISGKPLLSLPAFIPIVFELTILFSAFGAVFGMLLLNRLPMLYRPLFRQGGFKRVTQDRIVIAIEAIDPQFDEMEVTAFLSAQGAADVQTVDK
ncbi:MAG: DUF3341 domain-containing protein [Phycisphaeraceae bacterium]|nr:DUF3341 domain-containing protein [Phycisphaeraceae bacterium]